MNVLQVAGFVGLADGIGKVLVLKLWSEALNPCRLLMLLKPVVRLLRK